MVTDPCNESTSDPPPPEPIGVARLLRQAREQRGLTLQQVAQETKVSVERLAALEAEGLAHSDRGFYRRARIRAYARAVDLDERIVLAELEREAPPAAPATVPEPPRAHARLPPSEHIVMLVVGVAVVAGISRAVWEASVRDTDDHAAPIALSLPPEPDADAPTATVPAVVQSPPPVATSAPRVAISTPVVGVEEVPTREPEPRVQSTTRPLTELVIATDPEEARVAVNGIGWGSTPITIQHLTPGEKRIRVTKDGYAAVERVTNVLEDRSTTVSISMEPAP